MITDLFSSFSLSAFGCQLCPAGARLAHIPPAIGAANLRRLRGVCAARRNPERFPAKDFKTPNL
jgi:hypothetical protein